MKTLKIKEETHKKLNQLKANTGLKTLDETIDWLMEYFYYTPIKYEEKHDK